MMQQSEFEPRVAQGKRPEQSDRGEFRRGGKSGFWAFLASTAAIGLFAGCAAVPVKEPAELVAARAKDRWLALIDGDLARAYTFLSEGTRQAVSLERYQSGIKPGLWRKAEVDAVECKESVCKVRLLVTYDHRMMKNVTTPLNETWLIENGNAGLVLTK